MYLSTELILAVIVYSYTAGICAEYAHNKTSNLRGSILVSVAWPVLLVIQRWKKERN